MIQSQLPFEFQYEKLKPRGWFTSYRDYIITPMSSNNFWSPTDIVRFLITGTQGVADPYRSYFQFQVTTTKQLLPVGGLYIDNSSQSLISQTVISSRGIQVQRIQGYNFLANYLTDINFSQYVCQCRQSQGMGFTNFVYNDSVGGCGLNNFAVNTGWNPQGGFALTQTIANGISPTKFRSMPKGGSTINWSNFSSNMCVPNHVSSLNWLSQGPMNGTSAQQVVKQTNFGMNLRAQYKQAITTNIYPDAPNSYLGNSVSLPGIISNNNLGYNQITFDPKVPYQPLYNSSASDYYQIAQNGSGDGVLVQIPNTATYLGYQNLFAPPFSKGSFQPMISPTIPQCQIQNGQILANKVPVFTKRFRVPLISSVFGLLIDPSQFILIPMSALNQMLIQMTLNPYALVSTGCSDVTQYDNTGANIPIKRNFVISQINFHIDLYLLFQKQNKTYIMQSLSKQIYVGSTYWSLGSQYQIPNGQLLNNAWPTTSTAQFMNQIVFFLTPNCYQLYPYCRQSTRLSGNITSMQIRFNAQFYPPQPIVGNAGNPQILDSTMDNTPFYNQLLKSLDYMFSTNYPAPKINKYNFAVNNRIYDPSNKGSLYPPSAYMNPQSTQGPINGDTAMGQPYIHQQRYNGKAAFVYTWQPYGHSKGAIHGINANLARPFQIVLNCAPDGYFPRDQTMYIFIRSSVIVRYSNQGITVIGK